MDDHLRVTASSNPADWTAAGLELLSLLAIPLYWLAIAVHEAFGWAALPVALVAGLGWWRIGYRRGAITYAALRALVIIALVGLTLWILSDRFVICDSYNCSTEYREHNLTVLLVGIAPLIVTYVLSSVASASVVARASAHRGAPATSIT